MTILVLANVINKINVMIQRIIGVLIRVLASAKRFNVLLINPFGTIQLALVTVNKCLVVVEQHQNGMYRNVYVYVTNLKNALMQNQLGMSKHVLVNVIKKASAQLQNQNGTI